MNRRLCELLRSYGRVAIGFSGGTDSTYLLWSAIQVLGAEQVLAIIADTPTLPRREFAAALRFAEELGVRTLVVRPNELQDPAYRANPQDRCYICKQHIFGTIKAAATMEGFDMVLDGGNVDDGNDYRPGKKAALELGVKSPLAEAGMTKAEIRAASAEAGLPTAQTPANACLATRIPAGTPITLERLQQIEQAEEGLHDLGLVHCRVRHHDDVARIEVPVQDMRRVMEMRERVLEVVTAAGYRFVALDLGGYRMGNMNGAAGVSREQAQDRK